MKTASAFAVVLALLGSFSAYATVRGATSRELTVIRTLIQENVNDPNSVQLRRVRFSPTEKRSVFTVYGEVNAKNGFGGYSGFVKFLGLYDSGCVDGKPSAYIMQIDDSEYNMAATICLKEGM